MQAPSSVGSAAQVAEYRLSPAAERDLEGIWKYTRREWGLEQADRHTDLLTAAFKVGTSRNDLAFRDCMLNNQ